LGLPVGPWEEAGKNVGREDRYDSEGTGVTERGFGGGECNRFVLTAGGADSDFALCEAGELGMK